MLVTLDFETYWDKDFTLTKLSTSEYIRDERFEAISCAIKLDNKRTKVFFGSDIKAALDEIDWSKTELLAHHCHFDGLILSHHYGHIPAIYRDTLSLGRALHPKAERNDLATLSAKYNVLNKLEMPDFKGKHYIQLTKDEKTKIRKYNARDVDATYEIYQIMVKDFPTDELELIDITCRMFCVPVMRVDLDLAQKELENEQDRKAKAIQQSGADLAVLSSNPKFAKALAALGVVVPTKLAKPTPTNPSTTRRIPAIGKTDEDFVALLTHPDDKIVKLVEGRLAAKSTQQESKAARLLLRGKNGWRFPLYLNYAGAHTYRWSGGDKLNPQNFKHGHKVGGGLKKALMSPSSDEVIVVADASQIECRLLAWFFDEEWILDAFREERDIYCEFASDAYHRPISKADQQERFVGKTCVLGLGYQMGGPKLQYSLLTKSIEQGLTPVRLPVDVCYSLVNTYREKCANIKSGWDMIGQQGIGAMLTGEEWEYKGCVFREGEVLLPNGLCMRYPGLDADTRKGMRSTDAEIILNASYLSSKARSKLYGGLFTENLIQALARIHVADCMRLIAQKRRVVAMEHDAIGFITKKELGQIDLDWCIKLMSTPPTWAPGIPLAAEGKFGERYPK